MRSSLLLSVPLGLLTLACTPSGGTGPTGSPVIPQDGGVAPQQDTETCTGDTTKCLSGTAQTKSLAAPQAYFASLYTMLPLGGAAPVAQQQVARDGTWAFSDLSEGEHYYVQIAAVYGEGADGGGGNAIGATVGPLAVPASGSTQAVVVKPVQLTVEQSATSGGALELVSALAYVFDPTTGAPSTGNDTVTIGVGGTQVPMPWTAIAPNVYAYSATFTSPTPAQSTYTITTSSSASWQLVANTPSFTPSITAPASGATVPSGTDLLVSWARAADGGRGARPPLRPDDRRRPVDGGQPVRCAASLEHHPGDLAGERDRRRPAPRGRGVPRGKLPPHGRRLRHFRGDRELPESPRSDGHHASRKCTDLGRVSPSKPSVLRLTPRPESFHPLHGSAGSR